MNISQAINLFCLVASGISFSFWFESIWAGLFFVSFIIYVKEMRLFR
jgi:hypothetical protein